MAETIWQRYRCYNCKVPGTLDRFHEFALDEDDEARCPRCKGGPPAVVELVDHHFLVQAEDGPIDHGNVRYRIACMPKREYLALPDEVRKLMATGQADVVDCAKCRATPEWLAAAQNFRDLRRMIKKGLLTATVDPGGCCG